MTSNRVTFGIIDEQAKGGSTPVSDLTNAASSVLALVDNNSSVPHIATFEKDYWVLDGTYPFYVQSESSKRANGWWSKSLSDENGEFEVSPEIDIKFMYDVSSIGLTLIFEAGNVISDLNIEWYYRGQLISTSSVKGNTESTCIINNVVTAYDELRIYVLKTQYPERFAKIARIDYGIGRELAENDIVSMSASMAVNPISRELPVSTLTLSVYSDEAEFSILNPVGVYLALKEKQKFDVYHNGVLFARFYLKEWESVDNYNYTFVCDDAIGVMDGIPYDGGIYKNQSAKQLITDIVNTAGFDVVFEDDIESETVSGWIGIGSCRSALHQVLFAIGRMAFTATGTDTIEIRRYAGNSEVPTIDEMYMGEKLTLRDLVSAIELKTHEYVLQTDVQTIYSSELEAGDNRIEFGNPYSDYVVSGGELIDSNPNYCVVRVESKGYVTISAKTYNDNTNVVRSVMHVGAKENIIRVNDATMVSPASAARIMDVMRKYYECRIQRDFSYDFENVGKCGDAVSVSNIFNTRNKCVVESMGIDMVTDVVNASMVVIDE